MSRRSNENENGPPWNKDAERAVLGSMIHENNVIPAVLAIVQASDFYADYHQKIFRAIADLDKRQQPIDLVLLAEELVKRDQLKDIGGGSYLADLWDTAATAANAEYYAHLVRDYSARRGLIYLGKDTAYKAELGTAPVSELIEATRGELTSLEKVSTPVAAIPEYDADQLAHSEHGEHLDYLPLLGQEGYLVRRWSHLVAGYPRSGKTELLSACCRDWLALGERVLYLTEEPLDIWRPRLARAQEAWKGMKLVTAFGMGLAAIHKRLRDGPESIVILDTIRGLGIVHGDENDNAGIGKQLMPWIVSARKTQKTLILLHHARKGGGQHGEAIAGAHALLGSVDIGLVLERDVAASRRVITAHARVIQPPELMYERRDDGTMHSLGTPDSVGLSDVRRRIREVLNGEWLTTADIRDSLDPKPSLRTVQYALVSEAKAGNIERDPPMSENVQRGIFRWKTTQRT